MSRAEGLAFNDAAPGAAGSKRAGNGAARGVVVDAVVGKKVDKIMSCASMK